MASRSHSGISNRGKNTLKMAGLWVIVLAIILVVLIAGFKGKAYGEKAGIWVLIAMFIYEVIVCSKFSDEYIYFDIMESSFVDRWIPLYNEVSFASVAIRVLSLLGIAISIIFGIFGYFGGLTYKIFGMSGVSFFSRYFIGGILFGVFIYYIVSAIGYIMVFKNIHYAYDNTQGALLNSGKGDYKGKGAVSFLSVNFPIIYLLLLFIPVARTFPIMNMTEKVSTLSNNGVENTQKSVDLYRNRNGLDADKNRVR